MKCDVCGVGERQEKLIRYNLQMEEKLIVVEHVPASVCDHCGETTLAPDIVGRLQNMIWQSRTPVKILETPVYEFA